MSRADDIIKDSEKGRKACACAEGGTMKDHESEEMYLETILVLKGERPAVRSIDIADKLGYAKSSVSRGVSLLQDRGYIKVADDGFIDFTEEGAKKAESLPDRTRYRRRNFRFDKTQRRQIISGFYLLKRIDIV